MVESWSSGLGLGWSNGGRMVVEWWSNRGRVVLGLGVGVSVRMSECGCEQVRVFSSTSEGFLVYK